MSKSLSQVINQSVDRLKNYGEMEQIGLINQLIDEVFSELFRVSRREF